MSFLIEDEKLLTACSNVWGKISIIVDSNIDNESVYNEKY